MGWLLANEKDASVLCAPPPAPKPFEIDEETKQKEKQIIGCQILNHKSINQTVVKYLGAGQFAACREYLRRSQRTLTEAFETTTCDEVLEKQKREEFGQLSKLIATELLLLDQLEECEVTSNRKYSTQFGFKKGRDLKQII